MNLSFEKLRVLKKKVGMMLILIVTVYHSYGQCPADRVVYNEPGKCGAFVNISRPCDNAPNHSAFYTVGVHNVISDCGTFRCTTRITVIDEEGPQFSNCGSKTVTLTDGQCGPNAFELLNPFDNCDAFGALTITPVNGNNYPLHHEFKPGNYNLSYRVTDRVGNSSVCSFSLSVVGIQNRTTAIACTKNLNLSLDSNCIAIVTPKIMLEGGPYGCYDDYKVKVYDELDRLIGDTLRAQHVGKKLRAEVISPEGNKCWGNVILEDKEPPVLNCKPIYTTCTSSTTPGAPLPVMVPFKAHLTSSNKFISAAGTPTRSLPIQVFGLTNGSIQSLSVVLRIKHTNVSQLSATIQAPDGSTRNLFLSLGTCTADDMEIRLEDAASQPYTALRDSCFSFGPAKKGTYRPQQTLSPLSAVNPNGIWTLTIADGVNGGGGSIESAIILFRQTGNTICLPTTKTVTFVNQGNHTLLVNGLDNCLPATLKYSDSIAEQSCDQLYESIIYRKWEATDQSGNKSQPCTQLVYLLRPDLSMVTLPPDYDDYEQPSLDCHDWSDRLPPVSVTGTPGGEICKNIQVFPPEETKFPGCGNSYKLLRRWKISDWCTGEIITHDQIIKVADHDGPEMVCPADMTISASSHKCVALHKPARPRITKECSRITRYELSFFTPIDEDIIPKTSDFTRVGVTGDSVINELPIGMTYVRWTLRDECNNESHCIYKLTVRDEIAPVAICRQFTTVSIGANGGAWIPARNFDDRSYDNCGIVKWEARKMTNICDTINPDFADKIYFCCKEVGTRVMVSFRVTDASGNSNICMVEVRVEDKLPPYIICPTDRTIDCTQDFRDSLVSGVPEFGDNCGIDGKPSVKDSVNIDQCGRGLVLRIWSVKDIHGFTSRCTQRITVVNNFRFNRDSILCPADLDTTNCNVNFHPDSLPAKYGRPIIKNARCGLVATTYRDQVFKFAPGACEKIIRTWTIIDWCNYDEYSRRGVYECVQVLKLSNKTAPVFDVCRNDTVSIHDKCEGRVTQNKTASDDCTAANLIRYTWSVDIYNDGIAPDTMRGTGTSFDRILPVGTHLVKWTADDICGNSNTCKYLLTVRDGKKPTPYCLSSISTVVMPSAGMIAIWAKDFDYGSFDNCTPKNKLKISFSSDIKDTSRIFRCADIPDGKSQMVPLKMWVTDEAGNQEYCDVSIIIQDNTGNVCPDVNIAPRSISGVVVYEDQTPVVGAEIYIKSTDKTEPKLFTNAAGAFAVNNIIANGNLEVTAEKDDDPMRGINTLDLVFIQRHILAIDRFKKPEQFLAADINKDGRISIGDIIDLRKLILGVETKLPNGSNPFRIVETSSLGGNSSNNFQYKEMVEIKPGQSSSPNTNFTAVKIGDLDKSSLKGLLSRSSGNLLNLTYDVGPKGITVRAAENKEIYGMQMQLVLNTTMVRYLQSGVLTLNENNYRIDSENNRIILSYHQGEALKINEGDILFEIVVQNSSVNNTQLALSESSFNQWYDSQETTNNEVRLVSKSQMSLNNKLTAFNAPNPFSQTTDILLDLHEVKEGNLQLTIFNITGQKVYQQTFLPDKGRNIFKITREDLGESGVYQYVISYGNDRFTGRMILTN